MPNLYPTPRKGFYVYKRKDRVEKYSAQRKYPNGFVKSGMFYSIEEAVNFLDQLPEDQFHLREYCTGIIPSQFE